jgi:hypothetical protein
MFEKIVSAAKPGDVIVFNAGGQGSGKTTATIGLPQHDRVILIMDGTLQNHCTRSRKHFERAFACGCSIDVRYIYSPWPMAVRNILRRAIEGTGRIVPLTRAANGHFHAPLTTLRLVEEFGGCEGFNVVGTRQLPTWQSGQVEAYSGWPNVSTNPLKNFAKSASLP